MKYFLLITSHEKRWFLCERPWERRSIGAMSIKIIRSSTIYHSFHETCLFKKFYGTLGTFTSSSFAWFLLKSCSSSRKTSNSGWGERKEENRWRIKNEINQSQIKIIDWIPFWELCLKFYILCIWKCLEAIAKLLSKLWPSLPCEFFQINFLPHSSTSHGLSRSNLLH